MPMLQFHFYKSKKFYCYIIKNVVLEVLQEPTIPLEPVNPKGTWKTTVLGLFAGLAAAILYVTFFGK